jgi:hypothetical protein
MLIDNIDAYYNFIETIKISIIQVINIFVKNIIK